MHIITLALGAYATSCYVVWAEGSKTCAVIDPGYQPERVLAETQRLGLAIEAILLTHGHFDHVGAVRDLAAETGCPVYIHGADLSLPPAFTAGPLYHTHTYREGDSLSLAGLTIRVLHTPGHTPGSVCLQTENALFCGDTLFAGSCGRTDLPGGSMAVLKESLKRLRSLPDELELYPGHGGSSTLGEEKRYNPYL